MWVQRSLEFLPTGYTVLAAFLVTKSLTEAMEGRQGLVLASSLRVPSIIVGKAQSGNLSMVTWASTVKKQRVRNAGIQLAFFFLWSSGPPSQGKLLPTHRTDILTSVYPIWIMVHRHPQWLFFHGKSRSCQIDKINHHTYLWDRVWYTHMCIHCIHCIRSGSFHTHHLKYLPFPCSNNLQNVLFWLC